MSAVAAPAELTLILNENGEIACPACGATDFVRFATEEVVDRAWGSDYPQFGVVVDSKNEDTSTLAERWECDGCHAPVDSPCAVESEARP